jgi:hypothetical protein
MRRGELTLPDFLVIGAMKAGSTSLMDDLGAMPEVFVPTVKELFFLCRDDVLSDWGTERYAKLFSGCRPDQICGEGSTGYSKIPDAPGVPRRTRQVLGTDVKLIYIVRNPLERLFSHHYHDYRVGLLPRDPDQAIRQSPALINYSRYMWQLQPWIDEFGPDRIHVVLFEEYVSQREHELRRIREFLGLSPAIPPESAGGSVQNRGEESRVLRGWTRHIRKMLTHRVWYKMWIQPHVPRFATNAAKAVLMAPPPERPPAPNAATQAALIEQLAPEAEALRLFMGRAEPLWRLESCGNKAMAKSESGQAAIPQESLR